MKRSGSAKKLKYLGKILVKARGGRTLSEVSEGIGISFGYLAKLERGEVARPKIEMLNKIIKFYGLDYDEVINLSDKLAEDIYWRLVDNRQAWDIIRKMEL